MTWRQNISENNKLHHEETVLHGKAHARNTLEPKKIPHFHPFCCHRCNAVDCHNGGGRGRLRIYESVYYRLCHGHQFVFLHTYSP